MAGSVIAIVNQKGGTGKTTVALNLAAGLSRRAPTAVVDADPQRSISQWIAIGADNNSLAGATAIGPSPAATIARLKSSHRYVVVDCPPAVQNPAIAMLLGQADLILVPVLPSPLDLWASVEMAALLRQARLKDPALRAYLVLNQVETRNALSRAMQQALAEFDLPVLEASLQRRAAYRSAAVEGVSVYALGARGARAVSDIEAIIEEIL